jgi:hypothetical protein
MPKQSLYIFSTLVRHAVDVSVVGILCQKISLSYMSGKMFVVVGYREGIGRALLFEKENDISRIWTLQKRKRKCHTKHGCLWLSGSKLCAGHLYISLADILIF